MVGRLGNPRFAALALITTISILALGRERAQVVLGRMGLTSVNGRVTLPGGSSIMVDFRSLLPLYEIYFLRCYEAVPGFAPEMGESVIDVGASVGVYSFRCSTAVGPTGRVIAVEPHPGAYRLLERNMLNTGASNIYLERVALSSEEGSALLYFASDSNVGTLQPQAGPFAEVGVMTLDGLIERFHLSSVALVKIDVEGAEVMVLRGATKSLREGRIARLAIEMHEDRAIDEIRDILESAGYSVTVRHFKPGLLGASFPVVFASRRAVLR
jgi:FkbM family methyltransferase